MSAIRQAIEALETAESECRDLAYDHPSRIEFRTAIASLRAPPPVQANGMTGEVKPLEWRDDGYKNGPTYFAWTPFWQYAIKADSDHEYPWVVKPFPGKGAPSNYQTLEEAKAAAEKDYMERIQSSLSALPVQADRAGVGEVEKVVEYWKTVNVTGDAPLITRDCVMMARYIASALRSPARGEGEP